MIQNDIAQNIKITAELGEYRSEEVDKIRQERHSMCNNAFIITHSFSKPFVYCFLVVEYFFVTYTCVIG